MKAGDLCRVIKKGTHRPCQHGQYVIILKPVSPLNKTLEAPKYWEAINQTTGKWHHHHKDALEAVCK